MDYVVRTPPQIFYHFSLISNVFIDIHECNLDNLYIVLLSKSVMS